MEFHRFWYVAKFKGILSSLLCLESVPVVHWQKIHIKCSKSIQLLHSVHLISALKVFPWNILSVFQWYTFGTFDKCPKSVPGDSNHSKMRLWYILGTSWGIKWGVSLKHFWMFEWKSYGMIHQSISKTLLGQLVLTGKVLLTSNSHTRKPDKMTCFQATTSVFKEITISTMNPSPVGTNLFGVFSRHSIFVLFWHYGFGIKCYFAQMYRFL